MDKDDQAKLEGAQREIEKYLNLPITRRICAVNEAEQKTLLKIIVNDDISSIETLFAHFTAIGHLRGLRAGHALLMDELEEIQAELANTPNEQS